MLKGWLESQHMRPRMPNSANQTLVKTGFTFAPGFERQGPVGDDASDRLSIDVLTDCRQEAEQMTAVDVFGWRYRAGSLPMPYTRPNRRFYLTPPAIPTFVISVLLAVLAVLAVYGHIAQLHSIGGFTLLLIAYVVLLLGTLFRGI